MCGRTGMSWRRRSTPGSRRESRGEDDRVCPRRGEGLRSFQGARERRKTAPWQPAGSGIRLPLKESDIRVAVNPKSADGPSNNPQCGFWDSQFSAAQVKSVEQPCPGEDAGLLANPRGVLGEAAITDVMRTVFDSPVLANGASGFLGRGDNVADVVGRLVGIFPKSRGRRALEGVALNADDAGNMLVPFAAGQRLAWQKDLIGSRFVAQALVFIDRAGLFTW